jgi:phospholipid/cholesterol/gamma-HCH transport system permease protein
MEAVGPERVQVVAEADGALRVRLAGRWSLEEGLPATTPAVRALESKPGPRRLVLDGTALGSWDTSVVTFAHALAASASARGIPVETAALPAGARRLVALALAVAPRDHPVAEPDDAVTARVGRVALRAWDTAADATTFLGETVLAFLRFLGGKARFRGADLAHALETTGVAALGLVALINFLIGAVLAFVGAVQLRPFGATLYVASLVAVAVTRELGALMTGMVMAGRSGAAFAAVLGTMTVSEEVDALRTLGLRPAEFLVLPRVLATVFMMPALVVYADLLGLLGGMFVGISVLDLGAIEYLRHTRDSLPLRHVLIGVGKGAAFGLVVALTGCYYGLRCGRSAAAVGDAATRAVVMGVVLVVVVDALFTVLLHVARL